MDSCLFTQGALAQSETLIASPKIWTRIADSTSYGDNRYANSARTNCIANWADRPLLVSSILIGHLILLALWQTKQLSTSNLYFVFTICDGLVWFLRLDGISVLQGYLMPNPSLKKNSRETIQPIAGGGWVGSGVHTFPKSSRMKVIARLQFKPAYYLVAVWYEDSSYSISDDKLVFLKKLVWSSLGACP